MNGRSKRDWLVVAFLRVRHDREGNCHSELESGLALAWFPLHIAHKPSWLGIHLGLHEG